MIVPIYKSMFLSFSKIELCSMSHVSRETSMGETCSHNYNHTLRLDVGAIRRKHIFRPRYFARKSMLSGFSKILVPALFGLLSLSDTKDCHYYPL